MFYAIRQLKTLIEQDLHTYFQCTCDPALNVVIEQATVKMTTLLYHSTLSAAPHKIQQDMHRIVGAHRVFMDLLVHGLYVSSGDVKQTQSMQALWDAAADYLSKFCLKNSLNQKALLKSVARMLPGLRKGFVGNKSILIVLSAIFNDLDHEGHYVPVQELVWSCTHLIQTDKPVELECIFSLLRNMICVFREKALRPNQITVINEILHINNLHRIPFVLGFKHTRLDPIAERNGMIQDYVARHSIEDVVTFTTTNNTIGDTKVLLHAAAMELLALCCLGKMPSNEVKAMLKFPLEVHTFLYKKKFCKFAAEHLKLTYDERLLPLSCNGS